ncbi:MAG: excinuclease ABC subunit UvrB [candidate division FCPU426 bacterium]
MPIDFKLKSDYKPEGDQPAAIESLVAGVLAGKHHQTLLGVTGSGKTFTMANLVARLNRPTLIISHNKTLAAQLFGEFKSFFPENRVEYFVSYYDYYQPEAYVASTDTYIEKDSAINDELDRLRLSATRSLLERRDTLVVSSVSCIYGLGDPDVYRGMYLLLEQGKTYVRDALIKKLVEMQYTRSRVDFYRGMFRVRGDKLEIFPAYGDEVLCLDFFGDELEKITEADALTGATLRRHESFGIYPAKIYVMPSSEMERAIADIRAELKERLGELKADNKLLEAQRLEQRTRFDLEMLRETGTCQGIENYSRHMENREAGTPPKTLLDYLPPDALVMVDESHVSLPQIRGMYEGDRSRKSNLVEYGFRLPSAMDNRPLYFEEFEARVPRAIYVSATPGDYELKHSKGAIAEQIIRPTGLIDPQVEQRPSKGQIDDLMAEVRLRAAKNERVLVTTLTKRMAEELTDYFKENGIRVEYLHSDIETMDRVKILRSLRLGEFDCLVGINLLREGLDLPEVSLVAILDADKEGFLRSDKSLIQTMGRAARNVEGRVILYADKNTDSMKRAVAETERRRARQLEYNKEHGITPTSIRSSIKEVLNSVYEQDYFTIAAPQSPAASEYLDPEAVPRLIVRIEKEMRSAAGAMEFERAAELRDQVVRLRSLKPGESLTQGELFRFTAKPDRVTKRGAGRMPRGESPGKPGRWKGKPRSRP